MRAELDQVQVEAGTCALHAFHRPKPLLLVIHHVQPRGMGGADVSENRVAVCDTGHRNAHMELAALVFGTPSPGGTKSEKALAQRGYDAWVAADKPGNPHAAYALHAHP